MTIEREDTRLTEYALGELSGNDKRLFEAELAVNPRARRQLSGIEETLDALRTEFRREDTPALDDERRAIIEERSRQPVRSGKKVLLRSAGFLALAAGAALVVGTSFHARPVETTSSVTLSSARGSESLAAPAPTSEQVTLSPATEPEPAVDLEEDAEMALNGALLSGEEERFAGGVADLPGMRVVRRSSRGLDSADKPEGSGRDPSRQRRIRTLDAENPATERRNRDAYDTIIDNPFVRVTSDPRSTFSIDVDTASYSLVRRHLIEQRVMPPRGAVRIEELVNYFDYSYAGPEGGRPFSVRTDVASAPWAPSHRLLRIGIQGKALAQPEVPAANLVFLIDVSGSMADANKLPLLKRGLALLAERLRDRDRVAIVVYAGSSGLVLPATRGSDRRAILGALDRLDAGGSTNGGEGIELAYNVAREGFVKGGVNRVILATDGDFNVGVTNTDALVALVTRQAKSGVFLSVLGFGSGNYNDSMLEKLADKGNGNYAYIDQLGEARKVLVEQASGTLVTIAKDVKIQIEFNPKRVESFRLLGYENRVLAHRDFNDDRKDAGEIGAGHQVTALYEIVPAGSRSPDVDPLKYQPSPRQAPSDTSGELATVKLRFKTPEGNTSELIEAIVRDSGADIGRAAPDFRFAAAVAELGMLLRGSTHRGDASYDEVLELAAPAASDERRSEFLRVVRAARALAGAR